jgi:hypothetical protein
MNKLQIESRSTWLLILQMKLAFSNKSWSHSSAPIVGQGTNRIDLLSSTKVKGQAVERIDKGCVTHQWHRVKASLLKSPPRFTESIPSKRRLKTIFVLQIKSTLQFCKVKIKTNSSRCCCFNRWWRNKILDATKLQKSAKLAKVLQIFSKSQSNSWHDHSLNSDSDSSVVVLIADDDPKWKS